MNQSIYLSTKQSIYQSTNLFMYVCNINVSVNLSIYQSIQQSINQIIYQSLNQSIHLSLSIQGLGQDSEMTLASKPQSSTSPARASADGASAVHRMSALPRSRFTSGRCLNGETVVQTVTKQHMYIIITSCGGTTYFRKPSYVSHAI